MLCAVRLCIFVRFSLKLPAWGLNKPAYSVALKCARLMSGCVHSDTRRRHYRLATSEKPGETGRSFHSVCRELHVGLLLGVAKDGCEHSLCGKV